LYYRQRCWGFDAGLGFNFVSLFYLVGLQIYGLLFYWFFWERVAFCLFLYLVFISNIGVPPSLSFFSEFLAVGSMYYGFLLGFVVLGYWFDRFFFLH
uniref:Rod shape-determining protein MreD n=1 Tax=Dracunculus medinensis TaxID=318479 RepID=A0A0N4U7W7_DRAME